MNPFSIFSLTNHSTSISNAYLELLHLVNGSNNSQGSSSTHNITYWLIDESISETPFLNWGEKKKYKMLTIGNLRFDLMGNLF